MSQNPDSQTGRFQPGNPYRWRKGTSGNPTGRPRAVRLAGEEREAKQRPTDAVKWIEQNFIDPATVKFKTAAKDYANARTLELQPYQRRILSHVLTPDGSGRLPYSQVLWSQVKKSGKTTVAAAVASWWAATVEAPNELIVCANDEEQAAGRIFAAAGPTIWPIAGDWPQGKTSVNEVRLPNGTTVRAIPSSFSTEAGANHGLVLYSELWAYSSERARRLFEELTPVPTRLNSVAWIETYAGFWDESDLLREMWERIFCNMNGTELQSGVQAVEELADIMTTDGEGNERPACYAIPQEEFFVFWDHTPRMPWQTEKYYTAQRARLRESAYVRLHENRWQQSADKFITDEMWRQSLTLGGPSDLPATFAVDASQRNDTTALVGVRREGDRYRTCYLRAWNPGGRDIDLDETVAAEILRLHGEGLIMGPVWYDPFQMHQVGVNLRKAGISCREFVQGEERLRSDSFLYRLYRDGKIDNWDDPTLAQHVRAAKVKELDEERMRLTKGRMGDALSRKIDLAVAQAMAAYRASYPGRNPWSFA
jgi:hypothetical protein